MSVDPSKPGLFGCLRGDAGEGWRLFVTVAVCLLCVLLILTVEVAFSGPG